MAFFSPLGKVTECNLALGSGMVQKYWPGRLLRRVARHQKGEDDTSGTWPDDQAGHQGAKTRAADVPRPITLYFLGWPTRCGSPVILSCKRQDSGRCRSLCDSTRSRIPGDTSRVISTCYSLIIADSWALGVPRPQTFIPDLEDDWCYKLSITSSISLNATHPIGYTHIKLAFHATQKPKIVPQLSLTNGGQSMELFII